MAAFMLVKYAYDVQRKKIFKKNTAYPKVIFYITQLK